MNVQELKGAVCHMLDDMAIFRHVPKSGFKYPTTDQMRTLDNIHEQTRQMPVWVEGLSRSKQVQITAKFQLINSLYLQYIRGYRPLEHVSKKICYCLDGVNSLLCDG